MNDFRPLEAEHGACVSICVIGNGERGSFCEIGAKAVAVCWKHSMEVAVLMGQNGGGRNVLVASMNSCLGGLIVTASAVANQWQSEYCQRFYIGCPWSGRWIDGRERASMCREEAQVYSHGDPHLIPGGQAF